MGTPIEKITNYIYLKFSAATLHVSLLDLISHVKGVQSRKVR